MRNRLRSTPLYVLAALVSSLGAGPGRAEGGDAKADPAVAYVAMCTGCHTIPGYQSSFPRVYRVPKIGGQSARYIEAALQEYKKGERNHPTMTAVARTLTDDQITLVAGYFAARGEPTKDAAK